MTIRVRHPGTPPKDIDLGPCPEVRRRFYPRRADIDQQIAHAHKHPPRVSR